jgi:hypothetical protein
MERLMSSAMTILYTTIGGVIGAGLNQYVTHIKDRRSARGMVITILEDVEVALSGLRWQENDGRGPKKVATRIAQLGKLMASLESVCLVAGIPRAAVMTYASCCRIYENILRLRLVTGEAIKVAEYGSKLLADSNADLADDMKKLSDALNELGNLTPLLDELKDIEESVDELHVRALQRLGRMMWHPYLIVIYRTSLLNQERFLNSIDQRIRKLAARIQPLQPRYSVYREMLERFISSSDHSEN